MIVKSMRKVGAIKILFVYLLLAVFLVLGADAKKPTDAQIAKFKANYQEKLDTWLGSKTNETASCLNALITQLDQCHHTPYY